MLIEHRSQSPSTNDEVSQAAASGASEGLWIRADLQTAGRGRVGREWVSPQGNLYASTLVRLRGGDPAPASLALVAAVALDELLAAYTGQVRLSIKWPNDLLFDGAKLSGILLERSGDAVIVGFGVNLAHHPHGLDRAVTSLAAAVGVIADPTAFVEELATAFARWLGRWRGEGLAPVRSRWLARAHSLGTPLTVRTGDGNVSDGLFAGLDADGALLLQTANGLVTIAAGDVFLI